jgi:TPR repeat protein
MRPTFRACAAIAVALASFALIAGNADAAKKRSSEKRDSETATKTDQPPAAPVETRRAFVVGVKNYRDPGIQQLSLATNDAESIAADLKQVGFDDKNVKLYENPQSKEAFQAEFNKFVNTINKGDVVFFYFSGHGFAGTTSDGKPGNYLLFGDVKSQLEFARSRASSSEKSSPQLLAARADSRDVVIDYQTIEIPGHGMAETDILNQIQAREPRLAIVVMDACRTFLISSSKGIGRVGAGTTLNVNTDAPNGFMLIYSASHGQQAIEKFGETDNRKNSLFTGVFLDFMMTPGLDLTHLAKRVQDKVSQIAASAGQTQDPDYIDKVRNGDFYFIDPVGADRFALEDNSCEFAAEDMREIRERPRRDRLERHLKYFSKCPTAHEATQLLDVLSHGITVKDVTTDAALAKTVNTCDRLAASEEDFARPPEVPGVSFGKIDPDPAIAACDKAASDNPRVVRYLFNLARAYQRKAQLMADTDPNKKRVQGDAVIRYEDAKNKGYVAALNNLALMYDKGEGIERPDPDAATKLLQAGAKQGHPLAMYNLALRYRNGEGGLKRDISQAYENFAKAAEAGNAGAMVEVGRQLWCGCGAQADPVRAVEWLRRAANTGSDEAKRYLGILYYFGGRGATKDRNITADSSTSLLWFAQAAEEGDSVAQRFLAQMLEDGEGLASQQPQLAERYWRLSAYGGDVDAQVEFAEHLLSGRVLLKPENGPAEVVRLLQMAMSLGSSRAALRLAKLYRTGEFGYAVRPELAVKYAYKAIDLAVRAVDTGFRSAFDNPLDEIAAGILLAEMAANGEAVDGNGAQLLTQDERDRLERYYGKPDPETHQVKVRALGVWMSCGGPLPVRKFVWVWDWGREEAPTEPQFRYYESMKPSCMPYVDVYGVDGHRANTRDTLKALWDVVRKDQKVSFPDIVAAQAEASAINVNDSGSGRRH